MVMIYIQKKHELDQVLPDVPEAFSFCFLVFSAKDAYERAIQLSEKNSNHVFTITPSNT